MILSRKQIASYAIPEGYAAIAISKEQQDALLKICVLVKLEPDPVAGHFIIVRNTIGAITYQGCIVDSVGNVQQWVELFIQNFDIHSEDTILSCRNPVTNTILDSRWDSQFEGFKEIDSSGLIITGL